jgi:hypothetical protein
MEERAAARRRIEGQFVENLVVQPARNYRVEVECEELGVVYSSPLELPDSPGDMIDLGRIDVDRRRPS